MTDQELAVIEQQKSQAAARREEAMNRLAAAHGRRLEMVKKQVPLYLESKHFYTLDKGDTFTLTSAGYNALNEAAGLRWDNPATVNVDGQERSNPYIDRDPASGQIRAIYVARTVIGRSPTGNMVKAPAVICYDPEAYARAELFSKIKMRSEWNDKTKRRESSGKWGGAGRMVPTKAIDSGKVEIDDLTEIVMPLNPLVSIIANLTDSGVQDALGNGIENQKFAERKGATIAERIAFSKHPAMPNPTIPEAYIVRESIQKTGGNWPKILSAKAVIPIVGWLEPDTPDTGGANTKPEAEEVSYVDTEVSTAHEADFAESNVIDAEPSILAITQDALAALDRLANTGKDGAEVAGELAEATPLDESTTAEQAATVLKEAEYHLSNLSKEAE